MFTTWAEVAIEDFDQFLHVFATAGREARRHHGSLAAQAFRVPGDGQAARVLIDWRDRAAFDAFLADPLVKATMRSGGATRAPQFTMLERAGAFDA
ncbi:MAG: antibiotic biosynthesis monooxygenase [Burkholderiales bacterium]|nr:antibiotic biosynthesis monooxygenase [Burkholderiales bacterium]